MNASSNAKQFVFGLIQSFRNAFVKNQSVPSQFVVSLRIATNYCGEKVYINQFYSVLNFAVDITEDNIRVFLGESQIGFEDLSKLNWSLKSEYNFDLFNKGLAPIEDIYSKAISHVVNELKNKGVLSDIIMYEMDEIKESVIVEPHFNFIIPVKFKIVQVKNTSVLVEMTEL